MDGWITVKAVK